MAVNEEVPDWSIRALDEHDQSRILAFLERNHLLNIYLISRLQDEGFGPAGQTIEVRHRGEIVCVASVSSNVVLAADPRIKNDLLTKALGFVAEHIVQQSYPVRAIISEAYLVEELWKRLQWRVDPPTVVRLSQPVYAVDPANAPRENLQRVRYSSMDDLDKLVPACAAMHLEEVGIDPLARDAFGYRLRVRHLIEQRRSVLLREGSEIAFKCEYSAVTARAIQIMGVWTNPAMRRKGLASTALKELCGHIASQGKSVTLFVNDFNAPALALYESLGFQQIGRNRALIW